MSKGNPSPPAAPDPTATANAQAAANVWAAYQTAALNRVNQTGPRGSITYSQAPMSSGTPATSGNQNISVPGVGSFGIPGSYGGSSGVNSISGINTNPWTQTTTLDPNDQALLTGSQRLAQNAVNNYTGPNLAYSAGNSAAPVNSFTSGGTIQSAVGNTGNIQSSIPAYGQIENSIPGFGQVQTGLSPSGRVQSQANTNGIQPIPTADNAALNQAINSTYNQATSRLDPQWQLQQTELETQLANQGIPQNSDAWNKAMTQFTQEKNDAYTSAENQAVLTGNQVEQNQFGMGLEANQAGVGNALNLGNFANQAQNQRFNQNLASGQFANAAQSQGFGENATNAGFTNQAQAQGFGQNTTQANFANTAQNQAYQQAANNLLLNNAAQAQAYRQALSSSQFTNQAANQTFQNQLANQNLNNQASQLNLQDLATLFNLPNAVNNPSFAGVSQVNVNPADTLGAQSLSTQAQLAEYQQQVAQNSAKKGGLGSLGGTLGAAAILSDERTKTDIEPLDLRINGSNVYRFRYKSTGKIQTGFMAQEIEKTKPEAVRTINGVKHVDYALALAA